MLRLNGYSTAAFGKWHETAYLGMDRETLVSEYYDSRTGKFTGTIDKVTINLK